MKRDRNIQQVLYTLKREYSKSVAIYHPEDYAYNLQTGKKSKDLSVYEVRKAIVLDAKVSRDFVYDLTYIAANKNFTYGAFFDATERVCIIDRRDLPQGFEITLQDYVVYDNERYEIKDYNVTIDKSSYALLLRHVENSKPYDADLMALIASGWSASFLTKFAVDEFIKDVKYHIFSDTSVPPTLLVWLCCGNTLTDAIKCLWHPSGIGTALTNTGFTSSDYKERGIDAGLTNAANDYLDTAYKPFVQLTNNNFHYSIHGYDFTSPGHFVNCNDGTNKIELLNSTTLQANINAHTLDTSTIPSTSKHITVNTVTLESYEIYVNGVIDAQNTDLRSAALPNSNLTIFKSADSSAARVSFLSIGAGLTVGQILNLHTYVAKFNERLGRI